MLDNPWEGKSLLLVDDSATSRALVSALLKGLPISIEEARSASELYALLALREFDLVLLDVRLPDGHGIELLRDVRSRLPKASVVLVSGKADLLTATDALIHGADGYLDKHHLKEGPQAFRQALEYAMLHRARVLDRLELQTLKEEFQAVIVHDLRSPAASARVALKMFRDDPDMELLALAERNLERLFARLDRYLDYRRMEALSWRMSHEPHDFMEVVSEVIESLRPLAEEQQQEIQWEPEPSPTVLRMDRLWVAQAVENVLVNALKHTPSQSRVRVTTGLNSADVWVKIEDNGPGIPENLIPLLFQRFTRSSATRGGVGLGLAIVKNVMQAHGGTVQFQGKPSQGASFTLSFPREVDEATSSLQNL